MPATKQEHPPTPPGLEPALSTLYCPQCGHTGNYHHVDEIGCTECGCIATWVDILIIHVRLRHDP